MLLDLIQLTESAEKTSAALRKLNSQVAWERLSKLRDRGLVHDYLEVDLEDLRSFVRDELPRLRRQLDKLRYPEDED